VASSFVQSQVCSRTDETIRNYFIDVPHFNSYLNLKILLDGASADTVFFLRDLTIITYTDSTLTPFTSEFTDKSFTTATGWTVTGNKGLVSTCGKYSLFGGYNVFGPKVNATKVYTALPTHSFVKVSFELFYIDTWDFEKFTVNI
jgi:hypothetical protein